MSGCEPTPVRFPRPTMSAASIGGAAADHRLILQRCRACHKLQYPPEICCLHCRADDFDATESSGRGVIYSYSVVDRPLHAGFVAALPYVVALVELDDQSGLLILTNLVDVPAETQLRCGLPVEVTFEQRGAVTLPQFRLRKGAA